MKGLKQYFKTPETYTGMMLAMAFQVIFFFIWMTAYSGVNERLDHLKVALVNQDKKIEASFTKKLHESLPFSVAEQTSLEITKNQMDMRNWDMIVTIPANFSYQLHETGTANLDFYINQSSTTLTKSLMESAAKEVTTQINHQFNNKGIISHVIKTNEVSGFMPTMIPLMVILSSFVGAMLMSLQLNIATKKLQNSTGKWELLFSRLVINFMSSSLSATITLIFFEIFAVELTRAWWIAWLFQALILFTFLGVTQMSLIVFGKIGVYFNILLLATQLVTSGAIVPKALLSNSYQLVGKYLPATYGAEGYFNLIFGGGNLVQDFKMIFAILIISLLVTGVKITYANRIAKGLVARTALVK